MKTYTITARNHWIMEWGILLHLIFCCIIYLYFVNVNKTDTSFALKAATLIFLFQFVPTALLHLNYYFLNRDDKLVIDQLNQIMIFTSGENETMFSFNDIEQAKLYKSFALHKKNPQFLGWDGYNHALITLNNGTRIIITSLLFAPEVILPIEPTKVIVKQNLYRWAKGSSLIITK